MGQKGVGREGAPAIWLCDGGGRDAPLLGQIDPPSLKSTHTGIFRMVHVHVLCGGIEESRHLKG